MEAPCVNLSKRARIKAAPGPFACTNPSTETLAAESLLLRKTARGVTSFCEPSLKVAITTSFCCPSGLVNTAFFGKTEMPVGTTASAVSSLAPS